MNLLITRPRQDGERIAQQLERLGHQVTIEPLLEIVFDHTAKPDLHDIQALLFTSANGVRAFAQLSDIQVATVRSLPVFAVGDATAQAAATVGFNNVTSADGDVNSLADTIVRHMPSGAGPLLHVAGSVTAGDLAGMLSARGFTVRRAVLYQACVSKALSAKTLGRLRQGAFDYILFYSPRTARTFAQLAEKQGFQNDLGKITAACLSPAVHDALHSLAWQHIMVANEPTHDALMAALNIKMKS